MVETLLKMGCLPSMNAGFRWPIHRMILGAGIIGSRILGDGLEKFDS